MLYFSLTIFFLLFIKSISLFIIKYFFPLKQFLFGLIIPGTILRTFLNFKVLSTNIEFLDEIYNIFFL